MRRQLALFGDCMQIKEAPEPDDFCAQLARARTHAPHVHEELHTRMRAQEKIPEGAAVGGWNRYTLLLLPHPLSQGNSRVFATTLEQEAKRLCSTVEVHVCVWEASRL